MAWSEMRYILEYLNIHTRKQFLKQIIVPRTFCMTFGSFAVFRVGGGRTRMPQVVNEADVLVARHGAGLVNLLFAKPTTAVVRCRARPHSTRDQDGSLGSVFA